MFFVWGGDCLTSVIHSSQVSQNTAAPYGIIYHGSLRAVMPYFISYKDKLNFKSPLKGLINSL